MSGLIGEGDVPCPGSISFEHEHYQMKMGGKTSGRFGAKMSFNRILDPAAADATKGKTMASNLVVWCGEFPCPSFV